MILEEIYKKPFISFEFNQVDITVPIGTVVNVWLSVGADANIAGATQINTNYFTINCTTTGAFTYKATSRFSESNEIKITVI